MLASYAPILLLLSAAVIAAEHRFACYTGNLEETLECVSGIMEANDEVVRAEIGLEVVAAEKEGNRFTAEELAQKRCTMLEDVRHEWERREADKRRKAAKGDKECVLRVVGGSREPLPKGCAENGESDEAILGKWIKREDRRIGLNLYEMDRVLEDCLGKERLEKTFKYTRA